MEQTFSLTSETSEQPTPSLMDDEDTARSDTYAILAALLSDIPSRDLIDYLSHIGSAEKDQSPGEVGQAWLQLKQSALDSNPAMLDDEYHDLFIGVGRGEVIPYGSWHLTGFLMDKPLSELRDELRALGFEADPNRKEPEDHIAAVCETMSILITAEDIEGYQQRRFFMNHLHPWAEKFFSQLQGAKNANFYRAVGLLGEQFIQLESKYLNIQDH